MKTNVATPPPPPQTPAPHGLLSGERLAEIRKFIQEQVLAFGVEDDPWTKASVDLLAAFEAAAPWLLFYRDGKTIGEVQAACGIEAGLPVARSIMRNVRREKCAEMDALRHRLQQAQQELAEQEREKLDLMLELAVKKDQLFWMPMHLDRLREGVRVMSGYESEGLPPALKENIGYDISRFLGILADIEKGLGLSPAPAASPVPEAAGPQKGGVQG